MSTIPPPAAPDPAEVGAPMVTSTSAEAGRPQLVTVFVASYRLLLRSVATRGRVISVLALAGISVLTAVARHSQQPYDSLHAGTAFAAYMLFSIVPVAVLVFGAATIGDLIDDGSLVYLWLRPVPSWIYVAAAWAATVSITIPLVVIPVVLSTAIIDTSTDLLAATIIGGLVAVAAYAGLFVTGGIRFRRALPWGLAYILIWEGFIASAGKSAARLAIRSYTGSVLARMTGEHIKLANFTLASAIIVPLAAAVLALAYASRRLARSDVA
jgi:ABC-2 type transport system permease protein